MEQGRALAYRFQLLDHPGETIRGLADVEPVVLRQPVEAKPGELLERVAIGRDEAAIGDRLVADLRDRGAQPIEIAGVELAFAAVERVAQRRDLGIELAAESRA